MDEVEKEIEVKVLNVTDANDSIEKDQFGVEAEDFLKVFGGSFDKNAIRRVKYKINKYLSGREGTGSKQATESVSAYDILEAVPPPHNIYHLAELYEKSSWHYAAINAKVANVCGLGYKLEPSQKMKDGLASIDDEDKRGKARKKLARVTAEVESWLDSLNNYDLFIQTISNAYIDYQATGNGYIEVGRIVSGPNRGRIGYVGHIPSSTMRVRRAHDGYVQMIEDRVHFFRNFGDTETKDPLGIDDSPNEIIHLKDYSPINTYYGSPDIIPALTAVAGNEFAARFNLDFFEHRTAPRYFIISKGANLSPGSQKAIMEFLQAGLKGKNHRSLYIPLPPERDGAKVEIEFKPVENGIQDSSFENYRVSNRDEILAVHRVPLTKLGIVGANSGSTSASTDLDKTFKEVVCRPEQDILEKKINWIIQDKTNALSLRFNELTLTDSLSQSQIDERYLRLQAITPNEVREKMGYPPIADGDKVVDLSPKQAKQQRSTAGKTRARDSQRQLEASDSIGQPRNAKGEGSRRTQ